MKNILKLTTTVLLVLMTIVDSSAVSGHSDIVLEAVPTEKKLSIVIADLKEEHTVTIQDQEGVQLLEERTHEMKKYAKLLNLNNLPTGSYYVVIENSTRKTVQPIILSEKGVEVPEQRRKIYYKPVVTTKDGQVDISLFNGRITTVKVNIVDSRGETIVEEVFSNVITVQRRYMFDYLPFGRYTVRVSTPEQTYLDNFDVR